MRDQFAIPIPDDKLEELPFYIPPTDSPEMKYLHERRKALGGYLPQRRQKAEKIPPVPALAAFDAVLKGSGEGREISTTMAFVRMLTALVRDKEIGKHIVPIVPDEARTFGMEGMFRQLGIFASEGQKYEPVDKDQVMYYREDKQGQILEEGINEAGAFSSWIAAATSYSHSNDVTSAVLHLLFDVRPAAHRRPRLGGGRPARARLPARRDRGPHHAERRGPAARGRPLARVLVGDPELRLVRPDLRLRARGDHPGRPAAHGDQPGGRLLLHHPDERELRAPGDAAGRRSRASSRACTCCGNRKSKNKHARAAAWARGTILREVEAAAEMLEKDWGVRADVWSATSFTELRRDGLAAERWNMLHPESKPRAAVRHRVPGEAPAGPGGRRDRLHQDVRRPDPRRSCRAIASTACSAPTASAAPIRAPSCATSSR